MQAEKSHFSIRNYNGAIDQVSKRRYCGHVNTLGDTNVEFPNPAECSVVFDTATNTIKLTFPETPYTNIWSNGNIVSFNDVNGLDNPSANGVSTVYVQPGSVNLNAKNLHFGVQSILATDLPDDASRTYCGSIPSASVTAEPDQDSNPAFAPSLSSEMTEP